MFEEELRDIEKKIDRITDLLALIDDSDGNGAVTFSFSVNEKVHYTEQPPEAVNYSTAIDEDGNLNLEQKINKTRTVSNVSNLEMSKMLTSVLLDLKEQKKAINED